MRLLRNIILCFHVDREDLVDLCAGDLVQGAKVLDARVAHDDVDTAELLLGHLEEACDVCILRHVRLHGDGPDTMVVAGFCSDGVGSLLGGHIVDDNVCAVGG